MLAFSRARRPSHRDSPARPQCAHAGFVPSKGTLIASFDIVHTRYYFCGTIDSAELELWCVGRAFLPLEDILSLLTKQVLIPPKGHSLFYLLFIARFRRMANAAGFMYLCMDHYFCTTVVYRICRSLRCFCLPSAPGRLLGLATRRVNTTRYILHTSVRLSIVERPRLLSHAAAGPPVSGGVIP